MPVAARAPVRLYVDGGMIGHKNPSREGVIYSVGRERPDGSMVLWAERKEVRTHFTNNCAEYLALEGALAALLQFSGEPRLAIIHSDSQLIVNQFNEHWACKDEHLRRHLAEARRREIAARRAGWKIRVQWVRRQENVKRLGH